jgi:hypothetical protein
MAIVYRDISPISHNGSLLPYGITFPALHFIDEEPVSEPSSPREEGEIEVRPTEWYCFHFGCYRFLQIRPFTDTSEMKFREHKMSKYPTKKNMNKILRKNHKLKQPGGASCNQRR